MLSPFKDDKLKDGGITLFQASLVLVVKATSKPEFGRVIKETVFLYISVQDLHIFVQDILWLIFYVVV